MRTIVTGTANKNQIKKRMQGKVGRRPITPELMMMIKRQLKKSQMMISRRRIIWLCSAVCWAGCFRIHEILSRDKKFDPTSTLLLRDVTRTTVRVKGEMFNCLKVAIKHPKKRLSAGIILDIFEVKRVGDWMCPVKAWNSWMKHKVVILSQAKPAIRLANGANYTGARFNKDMKALLKDKVDYEKESLMAHSFRSGLATWMSQAGYSDSEIMAIGRWHSDAFLRYVKAPREKRALLAAELSSSVNQSIEFE